MMLSIESSAIESIADAIDLRQSVPMKRGSSAQCGGDLRRLILTYAASIAGRPDPTYKGLSRELLPNLHVNAYMVRVPSFYGQTKSYSLIKCQIVACVSYQPTLSNLEAYRL